MELKFRIWSLLEGQMIDNEYRKMAIDLDGNIIELINDIKVDLYQDKFTVMLWTGYNDRNGKPIFEGDIVAKCIYNFNPKVQIIENKGKVMNLLSNWIIDPEIADTYVTASDAWSVRTAYKNEDKCFYRSSGVNFTWTELKVIGNIFENPSMFQQERIDYGKD